MPGLKPRSLYKTRGDSVPAKALVDGPQALLMSELGWFLDDVAVARECYEKRQALAERRQQAT